MSSSGHSDDNSSGDEGIGSHQGAARGTQDLESIRKRLRSMYENEAAKRNSRRAVLVEQHLKPARGIRKPAIRSTAAAGHVVALPPSSGRKVLGGGSSAQAGAATGVAAKMAAATPASPVRRRAVGGGGAAVAARPPASVRDRVNLTLKKMKAKGGARR
jgi:hypothetical protein